MNPSAASVARGAIVAIVILLAALAGLVAGNAINPENQDLAPGAGRVFANVWGNHADADTTAPMAQDRVYENVWGNHADADEPQDASLTRPTLR